ncbi:hypothetical protein LVY72_14625 [Arthrobacter sp. I2-34]|uniref:Secreted protein n=1 Tax=Arthrobacter hankyongi TaxID=2904801 RepID=A0ABS9L8X9_9MICC|nr:hypothetical protein [Arthrobacter hankyongi]MCG2623134.1 hypothetical protein [Arthrobacter hankyongi]
MEAIGAVLIIVAIALPIIVAVRLKGTRQDLGKKRGRRSARRRPHPSDSDSSWGGAVFAGSSDSSGDAGGGGCD